MKFLLSTIALFISTICLIGAETEPPENIIVTVDGTPIMMKEVQEMIMTRFGRQLQQVPPAQREAIERQAQQMVLNDLISRTLLVNAANKDGIEVTDSEIDNRIAEISKGIPEGTSFDQFVASTGMSIDLIKQRIVQDSKVGKILDKVTKSIEQPSADTVKKYYDEHLDEFQQPATVQASHILVSTRGITDEAELDKKKQALADIQKQLSDDEGKSFEELAMAHSDCPSKAQGGDLGEFGKGQMVPEFEQAAFTQDVGVIGEPVETQFGYHLIKVTGKKQPKQLPFAEVEEKLGTRLFEEKKGEKISAYVEDLRTKAKIEVPNAPKVPEQ